MSDRTCSKCELAKFAHHTRIEGIGTERTDVVIVGDNPNFIEDNDGVYGSGNSHDLFLTLIKSAGLNMKELYYTPAVKCRKSEGGKVSAGQLKQCKIYLMEELERIKPKWVITLGATALKALTNKAKITEYHGKTIDHKMGFKVLPTFHPAMSLRDPRFWDRIHTDFRRFGKVIRGEALTKHVLEYERIVDQAGLDRVLLTLARSRVVAFDLETNGLQMRLKSSHIGQTVLSTFRHNFVIEHYKFNLWAMKKFHRELEETLEGKVVVAHNGKFDNLWLYFILGCRFPLTFDTMLASHLLDENSPNGLKQNARSLLDAEDWDVDLKIKKGQEITEEQRIQRAEYAAWDGYWTIRLYKLFKDKLSDDPELEGLFHKLVMPVARTYEQLEINGVHIDIENMNKAEVILKRKVRRITKSLNRHAKGHLKDLPVNWNSGKFLNELLFTRMGLTPAGFTEKGAPSTAEDNLVRMKSQHDIIAHLIEYRGVFKQLSGFIEGWKKRMIGGSLYPGFKVCGTVTGRPSCSNPNLQQVPRDPFIRSLVGAPEGWVFFEVDYSQVELRIAACVANEPTMLQVFRTGGDIHEATYQTIMGISTQDAVKHLSGNAQKAQLKEERKKAKAINFGFIYGMGWKTFQTYCETNMGLFITPSEAKSWRKRYFETYPGLKPWHERQRRLVRNMGMVRTFTGRIRHLPQINSPDFKLVGEAERNAINSPVQGFGAELILMSLVEVNDFFGNNILHLTGTIHDAMVGIVRKPHAEAAMSKIKQIMESPRIMEEFNIDLPLPIIADVSLGNWGIAKEYDPEELPHPIKLDKFYEPKKIL